MPSEVQKPRQASGREQRITGVNGVLKWHYFTAADVKSYTVTRTAQGQWTLTCALVNADAFKMAQKPLRFVAPFQSGEWRWVVDTISVRDGGACTASLYPPLLPDEKEIKGYGT